MKLFNHKFTFFLIIVLLLGTEFSTKAVWLAKAAYGGSARQFGVGFSIGAKGYIGTGWDAGGYKNDFYEYDPATNSWTKKTDFGGGPRIFAVGFAVGSKGYICTGQDFVGRLKDLWEYNPSTNVWTQKANFGGLARSRAVAFGIGAKGYVGTGYEDLTNTYYADFWEYDPSTNAWTKKADFGGGNRREAVGFSIGSKGYLGTGYNGLIDKNDFWQYDPATNTWIQKSNIPTAMWLAIGFSIGTKGYVGIGYGASNPLKEFWEYDTVSNTWTKKEDFGGTARFGACGFSIGLKGYVGTGLDINVARTKDFWEYQPAYIFTGTISPSKFCASNTLPISVSVPYTVIISFKPGNIFTAQLSDSSGSFATPINIGTRSDTTNGIISANIPINMPYGNKYRIRVISSNPSFIGADNKKDLSINPKPIPGFTINDSVQCLVGNVFTFNSTSTVVIGSIGQTIWNFGDTKTATSKNVNHTFSYDGTFQIYMKSVTDSGCADSIMKTVRVITAPDASFTSSDTSMCFTGNSFTFTNTSTIKVGIMNYKWFTGDKDSFTSKNLVHSYTKPGTYKVLLAVSSNLGCNDTAIQFVQIDSLPSVNFNINDSAQCLGSNKFVFTNLSSKAKFYLWSFGDGDTSGAKDTNHIYKNESSYLVKLKVFSNPTCADSLTKTIDVYSMPVASFSIDNDTQCIGSNIFNFTNTSTIKIGSFNSFWNFGDTKTDNTFNTSHSYTTAQTFNVKLLVTSNHGCKDSVFVPLVVLNSVAQLKYTTNNGPICEGQKLMLITDTIPFATYSWTGPNGFSDTAQNPVIAAATTLNSGTYQVVAKSMGCPTLPSSTNVMVKPLPGPPVVDTIINVCEAAALYLNASLAPDTATFDWTGPNGFTSNLPNPVVYNMTMAETGKYKVKGTIKGCQGPEANVQVFIHYKPRLFLGHDTNVCKGDKIILDPGVYKSYLWQDNSTGNTFEVTEQGKYWVEVVSEYGCVGSDTVNFSDLCPPKFFVPTAFSPNEDTYNDIFLPQGNNIFDYKMQVYNRWGVLMFETSNIEVGWNGKFKGTDCPMDLYYWYASWVSKWAGDEKHNSKSGGVYLTR